MKVLALICFFGLWSSLIFGQSPNIEWERTHPFPTDRNGVAVPQNKTGEDWYYHIRIV